MPANLDLTVTPLHRRDAQDQSYLPGLLAAEPPRRPARGRGDERLLLQLTVPIEIGLSPEAQKSLLQDMADGYFRTPGAVTSALREQIERLNAYFLQRNRQAGPSGTPAAAWLSILSFGEQRATLAQCGPVQAFLLGGDIQHFYDPQSAGRGLGLSQDTAIRFSQFELTVGQFVLLLAELPSGWNEKTLSDVQGQKLATLRRRFLSEAGPELRAALVAAQPGKGSLRLLSGQEMETREAAALLPPMARPPKEARSWEAVEVPEELEEAAPAPQAEVQPPEAEQVPAPAMEKGSWWNEISGRARSLWQHVTPPVAKFLQRVLPEEPVFNLPPRVMGLIAILVPVGVVILVAVVYLQFGRSQLYVNYLERAQNAAAIAAASQNPDEIRIAWEGVIYYAERAAHYEQDQQTAADLLAQAQTALDGLDGIRRVEFTPALFAPLAQNAHITRMVATNNEIYMLNATDGKVMRFFLGGDSGPGSYQLDANFACEPGPYGEFIVGKLVDLALLPRGNALDAELMAMDANGNVIYCASGERPSARTLTLPDTNWGTALAMAVENSNLYVLSGVGSPAQANAVWIYTGEDYSYAEEPRFFFGAEVPNLRRALHLAIELDDLYLIHEDGHMDLCHFSDDLEDPTTCEDPAQYTDTRLGRESGETIGGVIFAQLQISEPPQPALFLLDPVARAVYRLSLTLSLDTQFQSSTPLAEGLATAFAITPNRAILIAIDNEIYIGFMPSE
ncbi:MAG: hypothetical protein WEA61_09185 [Anaerolineales bacterium]